MIRYLTQGTVFISCCWNTDTHDAVAQGVFASESSALKFLTDLNLGAAPDKWMTGEDGRMRQSVGPLKFRVTEMAMKE